MLEYRLAVLSIIVFQIDINPMPLVNYEGDSSDEEDDQTTSAVVTTRRLHLPAPAHTTVKTIDTEIVDDDDESTEARSDPSSSLLAKLPKPQENSSAKTNTTTMEFPESELEDIVRGENKEYAKQIPQLPKPIKRKRDGPVKIFLPTIEQVSGDQQRLLIYLFASRIPMTRTNRNENNHPAHAYVHLSDSFIENRLTDIIELCIAEYTPSSHV